MKKGPSWTREHQKLLDHLVKSGEIDSKEIGPVRRAKKLLAERKGLFYWNNEQSELKSFGRSRTDTKALVKRQLARLKKWAMIAMRAKLIRRLKRDAVALQHAADRMRRRLYLLGNRSISDPLLLEGMERFKTALKYINKSDANDKNHREICERALKKSQEYTKLLADELQRCGENKTKNALQESQSAIAQIKADMAAGVKQKDKRVNAA